MGRAHPLTVDGGIFLLTHRCRDRRFLLRFACDRHAYRAKLREYLKALKISLPDYCLTSNHVHLLVEAQERVEASRFMRQAAGGFARAYNKRKDRSNAFGGDNFHATLA
jgi:putative transposase